MADNSTTSFPKMGDSLASNVMNLSGNRSPYTKTMPRRNKAGKSPIGSTGGTKKHTKINEANGPRCTVKFTLYAANAAEAGKQTRNVRMMPQKMSRPDGTGGGNFWAKRQFSQVAQ